MTVPMVRLSFDTDEDFKKWVTIIIVATKSE